MSINSFASRFQELKNIFQEITHLRGIRRLLDWDQETFMPQKGGQNRAEQTALLASLIHEKMTSSRTGELIEELFEQVEPKGPEKDEFVCLREWKRLFDRQKKLPASLVQELSRQSVLAHRAWAQARKEADFSIFLPFLQRLVELSRKKADCLGFDSSPYDALLDKYEPSATTVEIEELFLELVPALKTLLSKVQRNFSSRQNGLSGKFPIGAQKVLAQLAAARMGYDMSAGRIDTVLHPFSTKIGPGDCRITTRWNEQDFTEAFFGVLHEAGHAIYSQNLPQEHYGTPLGESVSLGIHESQSRFWENIIGRSRPFWKYFLPISRGIFPGELTDMDLDNFLRIINRVKASFIRVEADEITYNLHVYLRFVVERELIEGKLSPKDIPERWNGLFKDLFSLDVPNDALGCLQDVHWSGASFGYFPTYTLGNIYAAMFLKAIRRDVDQMESQIERGEFSLLSDWLKKNIHRHGQRYRAKELVEKVTGERPSALPLIEYLKDKYTGLEAGE